VNVVPSADADADADAGAALVAGVRGDPTPDESVQAAAESTTAVAATAVARSGRISNATSSVRFVDRAS
jgi:hypothetical protein